MSDSKNMQQIEAQYIPEFYVVGISIVTNNKDGRAAEDMNALWQKFHDEGILQRIEGRAESNIYAVYTDYEGDHTRNFRATIGCRVKEKPAQAPEGLRIVHIPSSNFAIFAARGEQPQALLRTWEGIWKSDLPRSFQADMEVYGPSFFEKDVHEILICIGVKV